MEIVAYTTSNCKYCTTLVELFERAGVDYKKILVQDRSSEANTISTAEFKSKYPDAVGYPYVLIDDVHIGGLVETAKLFMEKGLVTTKKNEWT